jgi:hypothetical protein
MLNRQFSSIRRHAPMSERSLLRRWRSAATAWPLLIGLGFWSPLSHSIEFPFTLPLTASGGGTLQLTAQLGGESADFLLDTGAGMVTVSRPLFERLEDAGVLQSVRRVALRMANNKLRPVDVYAVEHFFLGDCDLGRVELAVLGRDGRNLLGLSVLSRAAPFAVDTQAPALLLSHCGGAPRVAGLD